jgi:hypothetical protein
MAYYDALVAKWATLTPGTTQQKLDQINSLTVTGSVPTTFFTTGSAVLNCINYPEFKALTAQQQSNLFNMLSIQGPLLGGSANTAFMVAGMIIDYFPLAGPTVAALTALAQGTVQLWWQASVASGGGGLSSSVSTNDLLKAGGLT